MNLGLVAQYLTTPNFYRPSRSLIVNLNYLERVEANFFYLGYQGTSMAIPLVNRRELMKKLNVVRTKYE